MNGIWYYAIAFITIWAVALLFKDKLIKFGVDVNFPILMWKTKRLRGFINRIAKLSPRFWRWFMNVGIVISFGAMIIMTYLLISSLSTITTTPSVSLIIPGVEIPGSPIFVPFFYGLIGLATVIIVHEFSHGILARVEKINIKSIGLLLFTILPGAFVEPDENEMEMAKKSSKMRIYAAGSMANITLAIVALLIVFSISSYVIPTTFNEDGIKIERIIDGSPADNILKPGMVIQSIDGQNISDSNSYISVVEDLKPNEKITVTTNQGSYSFNVATNPENGSRGYMGIQGVKNFELKENVGNTFGNEIPWIWFSLLEMFNWIYFLNLAVGLFNLLPMKPLDGGHLLEELLSYKLSENIFKPISGFFTWFILIIIGISLIYGLGSSFF